MIRLRRIEPRHWRHLKKVTRHGFVFEDSTRPGSYWGTTWGGREKASGGTSVTEVARWLAWQPGEMSPELRKKYSGRKL